MDCVSHARRLSLIVTVGCIVLALSAPSEAAADAVTVSVSGPMPRSVGGLAVTGGELADRVTLGTDRRGYFSVRDLDGVVALAPCTASDDGMAATCPPLGPKVYFGLGQGDNELVVRTGTQAASVTYYGGHGDELVRVDADLRAFILPGLGRDTVIGGPGDDVLNDLGGADHLFGRGGHDLIRGGGGRDWMAGGPGPDRIHADNDDRDRSINCGGDPGDKAIIDLRLDPAPRGCARIRPPDR